jgi:hypothetical protein
VVQREKPAKVMYSLRERSPKTQYHEAPGQDQADYGSESITDKARLVFPLLHLHGLYSDGITVIVANRRLHVLTPKPAKARSMSAMAMLRQ